MTGKTDVKVVAAALANFISISDDLEALAACVLDALTADGRKVVGREATGAMLDAGYEAWSDKNHDCSDWSWSAMHDAAPKFTGGE